MNDKSKIPDSVLNALGEFSTCFIVFYFDNDGNPAYYSSFPETKDSMAMSQFLEVYVGTNGSMGQDDDEVAGEA